MKRYRARWVVPISSPPIADGASAGGAGENGGIVRGTEVGIVTGMTCGTAADPTVAVAGGAAGAAVAGDRCN